LLKDRIPAYVTWEQYEANRRRLRENDRCGGTSRTPHGRGPTLLNGLLTCGRCGRPMAARNSRPTADPRYACDVVKQEYGGPPCQSTSTVAIDRRIELLVLQAVEPASLELSLQAAERVELDRERLHRHWRQTLERAESRPAAPAGNTTPSIRRTGWPPGSWSVSGSRGWPNANGWTRSTPDSGTSSHGTSQRRIVSRSGGWRPTCRGCGTRPRRRWPTAGRSSGS
jgi:hypothetical protein